MSINNPDGQYTQSDLQNGIQIRINGERPWRLSLRLLSAGEGPRLLAPCAIVGDGLVGSVLQATPGEWSGEPVPMLAFTWLRNAVEIPDATGPHYTPQPADDSSVIACRVEASNSFGKAVALTDERVVKFAAPIAYADLVEEVFDQGIGPQSVDASAFFQGGDLSFSVTGTGAGVDAATGLVSISTDAAVEGQVIIVTAQNSGGSANVTLRVTVEAEEGEASVGFAGPSAVQLIFVEGLLSEPGRTPATGTTSYSADLDPTSRLGGAGALDGIEGNFSGRRNSAEPQLFTEWPRYSSTKYSSLFAIAVPERNVVPADNPEDWNLEVNERARTVAAVHRKTIPVGTGLVAPGTWRSERRHTVTLTLAEPLAPGDLVRIHPPGGREPLQQVFAPDVISEAVHVCHLGYPLGGPKKGYVGLWLGHDRLGSSGTTNPGISTTTGWRLLRISDGEAVASGALALAKAQAAGHQGGQNYNGCDVYVADFSSWDEPGRFRLEVIGVGASVPFEIGAQPYAEALRLAARSYFFQRSGCAIAAPYGEGITRPRNGHPADGLVVYQTDKLLGRHSEGFTPGADIFPVLQASPLNVSGGETLGSERTHMDSLSNTGRWAAVPAAFALSGARLLISGSGYRVGELALASPLQAGRDYRVTIVVDDISNSGSGLVARFVGAGALGLFAPLAKGRNTVRVTAIGNYPRLQLEAAGGTTGTVSSISVKEVTVDAGLTASPTNPDAWGGWHDAGDWDRRIQHMDTIYMMAQIIESFPAARTLDANIPESRKTFADPAVLAKKSGSDKGDGATILPDLIHEALWGISLWRRTQNPGTGAIIGGVEYSLDGIHGSVSWNPVQNTYAYGEEEWSAYRFAAAAAKLGHVIRTVCGDQILGQALVDEAVFAWTWAESVFATGVDAANGVGGDPGTVDRHIMLARLRAAACLYRAAGTVRARAVWESYNAFLRSSTTGLTRAGTAYGVRGDYAMEALDYVTAGREGRAVDAAISANIEAWCGGLFASENAARMGSDYGLHSTTLYPWGTPWFRFGPASNWRASRIALTAIAKAVVSPAQKAAVLEGMWFALGCNPGNVSLVQGLGQRQFADPLLVDFPFPGAVSVGPAAGPLQDYEINSIGDSLYPKTDADWPCYARIYESHRAIRSAEFGVKSNMMEWLFACAMSN